MSQETQKRQNKSHLLLKELATSGEQIVILCRVIVRTMQWTWILVRKINSRIFIKRRHPGRNSFFIHITCSTKQIGKTGDFIHTYAKHRIPWSTWSSENCALQYISWLQTNLHLSYLNALRVRADYVSSYICYCYLLKTKN